MNKLKRVGFIEGAPYQVGLQDDGPLYLADEVDAEIKRLVEALHEANMRADKHYEDESK